MKRQHIIAALLLAGSVAGCAAGTGDNGAFDSESSATGTTGGTEGTGATTDETQGGSSGSQTSGEGSTGAGSSSGAVFDLGTMPDLEPTSGCQKVDLLFVIDSTGSMGPHQQALIDSYGGFVDGISSYFGEDRDFHIGVISTDTYDFNEPNCQELGALVTQVPSSDYQDIVECGPYASGHRFMTEEDDLASAFPCTANLGPGGDFVEQPATAAIAAVQPDINAVGGCNEGFLRDDALLVIVMISNSMTGDDPGADANPKNDPSGWHQAIVDAKGGNPENAVAIGFLSSGDTWCIPNGWDGYQAPNLIQFVEDFGQNGILENVCQEDYAPAFTAAIDVVLDACAGFLPPG